MKQLVGLVALASLISSAAAAATVTNEDQITHKIVIEEAGSQRELTLKPNESVSGLCASTCGIWLGESDMGYDLLKTDNVTISKGELLFEELVPSPPKPNTQ